MAVKRKFDLENDDVGPTNAKQLKLVPFPNFEHDMDVAMDEAVPIVIQNHTRLPSDASSFSSVSSDESSAYPAFDLYPRPFLSTDSPVDSTSYPISDYIQSSPSRSHASSWDSTKKPSVGLMQPTNLGNTFAHHGTSCSQIPKLRVACASGINGRRTMWSFCEQCGAISMVDSD